MIEVVRGDITRLVVDAIVNAANNSLQGGGGVDGAIHRGAGHELRETCERIGYCATGEAVITPGFHLPARYIIHTVGPVWEGGDKDEAFLLDQCYRNSMKLAMEYEIRSIAFPAISTGAYGFPRDEAAHIALHAMWDFELHFDKIVACLHSVEDEKLYNDILYSPGFRERDTQ